MEEIKETRIRFAKLGGFYALTAVLIVGVQKILGYLLEAVAPAYTDSIYAVLIVSIFTMYVVCFPILYLLLKKFVPAVRIERSKIKPTQYIMAAVICIGLAYLANMIGNAITTFIGSVTGNPVNNVMFDITSQMHPAAILIYMVLLAPIGEELVFRKLLVDRTISYGEWPAVLISGLMFGLFHGNLNQFVYAMVIGMILAYLYAKTGDIRITISLHMLFNFIGGFISTLCLRGIDLQVYMEAASTGNVELLMRSVQQHLGAWIAFVFYILFVMAMLVAGIITFTVLLTTGGISFKKTETNMKKGQLYSAMFCNIGMMLFAAYWIYAICRQLLS